LALLETRTGWRDVEAGGARLDVLPEPVHDLVLAHPSLFGEGAITATLGIGEPGQDHDLEVGQIAAGLIGKGPAVLEGPPPLAGRCPARGHGPALQILAVPLLVLLADDGKSHRMPHIPEPRYPAQGRGRTAADPDRNVRTTDAFRLYVDVLAAVVLALE